MRQRPLTAVQRQQQQPRDIIPLPLDEVEVSIVVLAPDATTGSSSSSSIVPFRRMLAGPGVTDEQLQLSVTHSSSSSSSSSSSMSLAIVPRDSSTMLGVVMSSVVKRREDDVTLPVVSKSETPLK